MSPKSELQFFIVDDDLFHRKLYHRLLHNLGYSRIELFSDGGECLNQLYKKPDIILLDFMMNGLNGIETLQKIKEFDPHIVVIFITSKEDLGIAMSAMKFGSFDYILKSNLSEKEIKRVLTNIQSN